MKYPINLRRRNTLQALTGLGLGIQMSRLPVAAAKSKSAAIPSPTRQFGDFFIADFRGEAGVTVDQYVPDLGAPFTNDQLHLFHDPSFLPMGPLSYAVLRGDSSCWLGENPNPPQSLFIVGYLLTFKPGTQPSWPDYYVECSVTKTYQQQVNISVVGRMQVKTDKGNPDYEGCFFQHAGFAAPGAAATARISNRNGATTFLSDYFNPDLGYPSWEYPSVIRLELKGTTRIVTINGQLAGEDSIPDPNGNPGEIAVVANFSGRRVLDGIVNDPVQPIREPAPITSIRAGYL